MDVLATGREEAGRAYRRLRGGYPGPDETLDAVADVLPEEDPGDIRAWAVEDDWEGAWDADDALAPRRARPVMLSRDDDLTDDMGDLVARARAMSEEAEDGYRQGSVPFGAWLGATKLYLDARKDYSGERRLKEKLDQDAKDAQAWQPEVVALEGRLIGTYGPRGIQYEVLCIMLAPLVVKLRKSYAGRIRLSTEEQNSLNRTATALVAQLQKHTESTKTESSQVIKSVAVAVLGAVEPLLQGQPHLWARVVDEIDTRLKEGTLALADQE